MRLAEEAVLHSAALLRNTIAAPKKMLHSTSLDSDMPSLLPIDVDIAETHDAAAALIIFCQTSASDNSWIIGSVRYVQMLNFEKAQWNQTGSLRYC